MSFLKKSIILTNKNKGITYGIGVLTIEKNNGGVFGSFTSHDVNDHDLILGISASGNEVVKLDVLFDKSNTFNFRLPNSFDINDNIGAVLVRKENDNIIPIMWGANSNHAQLREDIIENIESDYKPLEKEIIETKTSVETLENQLHLFKEDDQMDELISKAVDDAIDEVDHNFYELIKPQLEQLFADYGHEENLENIIPNSKWVKVDFDGDGKEYVVGKIFEDDNLKYICYGVPGEFSTTPPEKLVKYSQWLPLDSSGEVGYWIMYQDAYTGEALQVG
ncbi:MAG: hypothetical protein J6X00_01700 [Clostridia bacterium]|nr:hypothetical protein [Clostridia bacterium]